MATIENFNVFDDKKFKKQGKNIFAMVNDRICNKLAEQKSYLIIAIKDFDFTWSLLKERFYRGNKKKMIPTYHFSACASKTNF